MKKTFTKFLAALALLAFFIPSMIAVGQTRETHNVTYSYSDLKDMLSGSYADASTYWKVPGTAGNTATISIPITNQPTSDITVTFRIATFGSGTNPSSSNTTITAVGTESNSNWSGSGVDSYPSSSTYVNGVMTITKPQNPTTLGGLVITMGVNSGIKIFRLQSITVSYSYGGTIPTTVTIDATGITNTDVYAGHAAGSLSATVTAGGSAVSGATVTWSSSATSVATINNSGVVTLVAAGTTTITASYAGNSTYDPSSKTYTLTVTDSTPFDGVIFDATEDTGTSPITKDGVSLACSNGVLDNGSEYRFYKNSNTTISITGGNKITKIEFTGVSNYAASGFGSQTGWSTSGNNGVWEGEAESVTFVASGAQVRATLIKVTVLEITTPSISADDVNIAYDATSGEIIYTLNNPVANGTLSVSENVDWISNPILNTTESKVTFTTTANEVTTARVGTITITYTYGDNETVSKDVTVTQDAAPETYSTIPALYEAATTTSTSVTVNLGGWIVTGVNGNQLFVTDGTNGLIMYQKDHGFAVNNTLSGTVECNLVLFNSSTEITGITSTTTGLTVGTGTVTPRETTIGSLGAVNTGSVVTLVNLTYNGTTLSDGTNSITPYNSLFTGAYDNGKKYNVTGVFVLNNTEKRILARNAADIVEVQDPYINASNVDITCDATNGNISYTIEHEPSPAGTLTATIVAGYTISNLSLGEQANGTISFTCDANTTSTARTAEITLAYTYGTNTQVTKTVTITQAAYVNPNTGTITFGSATGSTKIDGTSVTGNDSKGNTWTITTDGTTSFTQNADYSQVGSSKNPATSITFTTTLPQTMMFTSFEAKFGGFGGTTGNVSLNVGTTEVGSGNLDATNDVIVSASTTNAKGTTLTVTVTDIDKGVKCYYISYTAIPVLDITGYKTSEGGYYLIASPVASVTPSSDNGFIAETANDYDLYYFDQTGGDNGKEWKNYKAHNFAIVAGKGYLYASKSNTTLVFSGTPYSDTGEFDLTYDEQAPNYKGWNLVGNPYTTTATIDKDAFYRMNEQGTDVTIISGNGPIAPMEGIFVLANEEGENVTFTRGGAKRAENAQVSLNIVNNRGNVIDRAIVSFDENGKMPKFMIDETNTKIYIPQNDGDYAIVSSNGQSTMPVNFKAKEMGMYTISVETEGIDLSYLHLIDRLTGEDVNLLIDSKYSFIASNSDMESRFILSFNENGINANGNETFAFQNGNEIIVNGEGELQVFDVMGRMVNNTIVNGVEAIALPQGVYIFRLNENIQKIVVR